ncbi:hypothetical protein SNOG_00068 [Parastagonospora nodorum SN15]|uniref:Peptidase S28 n=1 Tax=Phaeosphaeria nodorum (strain SN15 / ATCC MYA-4574 / FGSC 10173) TaxID=321614 RepID=Q0V7E6_PHANO|nr:hypothetical protein SNOG_00068 [Parastagonospora nodorum SN15]EAT91563.2 hypothetical protein SNOG_00068 [Parastagonospora nodorum SN15]
MRFSAAITTLLLGLEAAALRTVPRTGPEIERAIAATEKRSLMKRDEDFDLSLLYPERNISVPVDFFHNETRYEPHSNGIVHQVIEATGGLGVILEHRYYGKSFPVDDLTTKNMRFLSTDQALAEIDYFARNVKFEGIDADLTAPNTPWVVYGGSYAGAQAAFMRVKYPETFWGAISSSGVTVAIYDYWQYFEPARLFGPPDCIKNTQILIDVIDNILLNDNNTAQVQPLKNVFGLGGITDNRDFAGQITGVYGLQSTNWDPEENSDSFFNYCTNITATPTAENLRPAVADIVNAAGYGSDTLAQNVTLNAISWINSTALRSYRRTNRTQDQYFTSVNATALQGQTDLSQYGAVSWSYQVCTEWGYIQTGNTPKDIMPLISRTLDVDYLTFFCRAQFNITEPPDVWQVNKYGNYSIDYERLAHIGGNADPWRPATPLWYPESRNSSTDHPWHLISHGVHHWEENGIFPNETTSLLPPAQVVYAQQFLKNFVVDWIAEWNSQKERLEL